MPLKRKPLSANPTTRTTWWNGPRLALQRTGCLFAAVSRSARQLGTPPTTQAPRQQGSPSFVQPGVPAALALPADSQLRSRLIVKEADHCVLPPPGRRPRPGTAAAPALEGLPGSKLSHLLDVPGIEGRFKEVPKAHALAGPMWWSALNTRLERSTAPAYQSDGWHIVSADCRSSANR